MNLLLSALSVYFFVLACWVLYLAVMNLAPHRYTMHPVAKVHAYILLFFGYGMDAILNLMACAVFMRKPRDWLFTGTMKRMINTEPVGSWREIAASWVCEFLLNPFDPKGPHC